MENPSLDKKINNKEHLNQTDIQMDWSLDEYVKHIPALVWLSRPDGLCTYFNQNWLDFVGRDIEDELGNGWADNVHPDDLEHCVGSWLKAVEQQQCLDLEFRLKRHDGEYRWILDNIITRFSESGEFLGFIGTCLDVTDQHTAKEIIEHQRDELVGLAVENKKLIADITIERNIAEQANTEKSQFLAAASHDLRQPLNAMGLFLYVLREKLKHSSDEKPISILSKIDYSYQALNDLFDALLEISHLDAGTINAENKNTQLAFVLGPLTDEMSEQATAKGLEFNYQPSNCYIKTDPILLSRIVRNLIGNAIKYTHEGKIEVSESIDGIAVNIKIIDTGIGIPEKEFKNIFSEYHQLANQKRDRRQGIGLGLSIVKKMCDLLGAEISVVSTVGKGSEFTLRLPLADEPVTIIKTTEQKAKSLKGIKALVIDDEPDVLMAMKLLLDGWECHSKTAETYRQALSDIENNTPDIILCDYRLQDNMTGIEAIEKLRMEINQDVPAIIITGNTDPALLKSIQAKGYNMLSKPIQPSLLQEKIGLLTNS